MTVDTVREGKWPVIKASIQEGRQVDKNEVVDEKKKEAVTKRRATERLVDLIPAYFSRESQVERGQEGRRKKEEQENRMQRKGKTRISKDQEWIGTSVYLTTQEK